MNRNIDCSLRVRTRESKKLVDYLVKQTFRDEDACWKYFESFFGDIDLKERRVLDIGAGLGWMSAYARTQGAEKVVALEPEAAGTTGGVVDEFNRMIDSLKLTNIQLHTKTIQDFKAQDGEFDLIASRSSINHINEDACRCLHQDTEAMDVYIEVFNHIADMTAMDGKIILTDSARQNLFAFMGLRNPLAPMIEWEVHQSPYMWAQILEGCGFGKRQISWVLRGPLRPLGKSLLAPVLAFLTTSHFRLEMTRL